MNIFITNEEAVLIIELAERIKKEHIKNIKSGMCYNNNETSIYEKERKKKEEQI